MVCAVQVLYYTLLYSTLLYATLLYCTLYYNRPPDSRGPRSAPQAVSAKRAGVSLIRHNSPKTCNSDKPESVNAPKNPEPSTGSKVRGACFDAQGLSNYFQLGFEPYL